MGSVVRVVALFAVVGVGLGAGMLIFLSVTGYFGRRGFQDAAKISLGSFAVSAVLIFALLIGVAIAGVGGAYLATASGSRRRAAAAGVIAGGVGHLALVVTAGVVLLVGLSVRSSGTTVETAPSPSAPSTASPAVPGLFGDAPCEETFGENSPLCTTARSVAPSLPVPQQAIQADTDVITAANFARVGIGGVVAAAFVGGVSASILFVRRRPEERETE